MHRLIPTVKIELRETGTNITILRLRASGRKRPFGRIDLPDQTTQSIGTGVAQALVNAELKFGAELVPEV